MDRFDERAGELDRARAAALVEVRAAEDAVGAARRAAAPRLAAAVTERLRTLALAHADVAVDVADPAVDPAGERVQFMFSANPGSPLLPLTKVASGGELARAMLALRLVLSGPDDAPDDATYVFDEVDAGIGGAAAGAVGAALAEVGRHHQVLVVTHLAQVAAQADAQVVVTKQVAGEVTTTGVDRGSWRGSRRRAGPHAVGRRGRRRRPPPRRRAAPPLTRRPTPRSGCAGSQSAIRLSSFPEPGNDDARIERQGPRTRASWANVATWTPSAPKT